MIFFFDANGNPIQNIPQKVYQGSNKASVIYFAYPLSSTLANVVFVNAAFNLPNGFNTEPQLMVKVTDTGLSNITDAEGNVYSVWQLSLTAPITSYSGNVTCQFFVTTSSAVVATASSQFFVEKGVLPVNPPAEGDSYQELLQYITDILTPLANEVEDLSNSYYPRQTGVSILENLVKVQDGVLSASIAPNIIAVSDNTVTNNLKAQAPAEDDELASIYNNYLPKKDGVLVVQDDVTSAIETALVPIQRELDDKYNKVDNVSIDTMGVTVIDASDSGDFAGLSAYGIELVKNGTPTNLSSQETADSSSVNLLLPKKSGTLALDGDLQDLEENITINTNNIKALFNLQLEKNVLAYDNAELTEEVQQTGGSELAGFTILDGSYATVNKISGNTVASKNLIPYPYVSQNTMESKQSLTLKSDGTIVANGNNIGWCKLANNTTIKLVGGKTYTLGGIPAGVSNASTIKLQIEFFDSENNVIMVIYTQKGESSVTFTLPETFASFDIFFYVENSTTVTNLVVKPMLNEGAEELPFVPFFEGLKNAQLSGIKSIGKNLYNNYGVSTAINPEVFMPYTESTMQFPQTVELGKWDYITFNENTGVATITRRTSIEAFNEQDYNEAENTYQGSTDFVLSVDKTLVAIIDENLPDEQINFDNKYLVWNGGIEEILTPTDADGYTCFDYGANTTEENSYYVIVGDNV